MFLRNLFLVVFILTLVNSLPTSISTDAETETEPNQGPLIAEDKFEEIEHEIKVEDAPIGGNWGAITWPIDGLSTMSHMSLSTDFIDFYL